MNSLNPQHTIWLERGMFLGQWLLALRSMFRHPKPVRNLNIYQPERAMEISCELKRVPTAEL